jgi:hypothetical protein
MRKLSEVLEALSVRWDAPLEEINGFSYVPWEETAYHLDEVFGPLGWSDRTTVPRLDTAEVRVNAGSRDNPRYETRDFQGYTCVVDIEVQVLDDVNGTGVMRVTKSGPGFGAIQAQGEKNPLNTAVKAAGSDGLSKAAKKLGDAFALYLYRKGTTGAQPARSAGAPARSSGGKPTAKQMEWLIKKGIPKDVAGLMSGAQAKTALDGLFGGDGPEAVMQALGFDAPTATMKRNGLPTPAGR